MFFADILAWSFISIFKEEKRPLSVPITIIDHNLDGSWEFFNGDYLTKIRLKNLEEAIQQDVSIQEISDLPPGISAERKTTKSAWKRYKKSKKDIVQQDGD